MGTMREEQHLEEEEEETCWEICSELTREDRRDGGDAIGLQYHTHRGAVRGVEGRRRRVSSPALSGPDPEARGSFFPTLSSL